MSVLKIGSSSSGLVLLFACLATQPMQAADLSYAINVGEKFSYRFSITVDAPDAVRTYKGITNYSVDSANGEQIRLTFNGGLPESKSYKNTSRGRFGGPFDRGFSSHSPFGSGSSFNGRNTTRNVITITPRGNVLTMEGNSQLPYLLGNVSLMPFEILPVGEKESWSTDSGISITQKETNNNSFGIPDPFFRGSTNQNKTIRAAGELTRYSIESEEGNLVKLKKTYQLSTPSTDKKESFDMTGAGTWTFDRESNLPHATDMKYKLIVSSGNTTTTVPVHVKFDRVSAAELAKMQEDAKRKMEETKARLAKEKAEAERPLSLAEITEAVDTLQSSDTEALVSILTKLSTKAVKDPDSKIADAIRPHLDSDVKNVKSMAAKAMSAWSPEYKKIADLQKAYTSIFNVKSTGRTVTSLTPLYVGQIIQVNEHGHYWKAAEITGLNSDGTVAIKMRSGGRRTKTVSRREIQLAPEELPQPKKPDVVPGQGQPLRTWSDQSGRFTVEGTFVKVESAQLHLLRKSDGKLLRIPVSKLNAADQEYLREMERKAQQVENPFEVVE